MDVRELARPCVHCGLCLPACPTYSLLKTETDSPRGRILLLAALEEGRAEARDVRRYIDQCIGCVACETACPSGVPYGAILEQGRARVGGPRWMGRFFLKRILPRPRLVRVLVAAGRMLGRLPPPAPVPPWPDPPQSARGRVKLHLGCLTDAVFPHLAREAAVLLARLGYRAEAPDDPGCCGALHRHAGIEPPGAHHDGMVSCAAGCSATGGLTDVCELLLKEMPLRGLRLPPVKVAYDAPCHLLHAQGVDASPLLDAIEGVERIPLAGAERCCGAGGLYMEQQARLARRVREAKLDAIAASGAQVVATPNPGCMIWIWRGLRERRLPVEVVHPITLLARTTT